MERISRSRCADRFLVGLAPLRNTNGDQVENIITHSPRQVHHVHISLVDLSLRTIYMYFFLSFLPLLINHFFRSICPFILAPFPLGLFHLFIHLGFLRAPSIASSTSFSTLLSRLDLDRFVPRDSFQGGLAELETLRLSMSTGTRSVLVVDYLSCGDDAPASLVQHPAQHSQ